MQKVDDDGLVEFECAKSISDRPDAISAFEQSVHLAVSTWIHKACTPTESSLFRSDVLAKLMNVIEECSIRVCTLNDNELAIFVVRPFHSLMYVDDILRVWSNVHHRRDRGRNHESITAKTPATAPRVTPKLDGSTIALKKDGAEKVSRRQQPQTGIATAKAVVVDDRVLSIHEDGDDPSAQDPASDMYTQILKPQYQPAYVKESVEDESRKKRTAQDGNETDVSSPKAARLETHVPVCDGSKNVGDKCIRRCHLDFDVLGGLASSMHLCADEYAGQVSLIASELDRNIRRLVISRILEALRKVFGTTRITGPYPLDDIPKPSTATSCPLPLTSSSSLQMSSRPSTVLCSFCSSVPPSLMSIDFQRTTLWEKSGFGPVAGPRDAVYYAITCSRHAEASEWFTYNLSAMYAACNLGSHQAGDLPTVPAKLQNKVTSRLLSSHIQTKLLVVSEATKEDAGAFEAAVATMCRRICKSVEDIRRQRESRARDAGWRDTASPPKAAVIYIIYESTPAAAANIVSKVARGMRRTGKGAARGQSDSMCWPPHVHLVFVAPKTCREVTATYQSLRGLACRIYGRLGTQLGVFDDNGRVLRVTRKLPIFQPNVLESYRYSLQEMKGGRDALSLGAAKSDRTIHVCYTVVPKHESSSGTEMCVASFCDGETGSVNLLVRCRCDIGNPIDAQNDEEGKSNDIAFLLQEASKVLLEMGVSRSSNGTAAGIKFHGTRSAAQASSSLQSARGVIALYRIGDITDDEISEWDSIRDENHDADAVALWRLHKESLLVSSDASHHAGHANMLPSLDGRTFVVAQRRNVDIAWQSPAVRKGTDTQIYDLHLST